MQIYGAVSVVNVYVRGVFQTQSNTYDGDFLRK